jgi:hypothetical protein
MHDKLVGACAIWFSARGFNVMAEAPGWQRPPNLLGWRPDIMGQSAHRTLQIIAEVETERSVGSSHTASQLCRLAKLAGRATKCYLIVPRAAVGISLEVVRDLGLSGPISVAYAELRTAKDERQY